MFDVDKLYAKVNRDIQFYRSFQKIKGIMHIMKKKSSDLKWQTVSLYIFQTINVGDM